MQGGHAGPVVHAPARATRVGAGLARTVRLLTAVVLLGTALLIVALVGQGTAGARGLVRAPDQEAPGSLPGPRPVTGDPAGTAALEHARADADTLLRQIPPDSARAGGTAAATSPPAQPGAPGDPRSGSTLEPESLGRALPSKRVQVARAPDGQDGQGEGVDSDLPPESVRVAAASGAVPFVATAPYVTMAAARKGPGRQPSQPAPTPSPSSRARPAKEMTPEQREAEASQLETDMYEAKLRLTLMDRLRPPPVDPQATPKVAAQQRQELDAHHAEWRRLVRDLEAKQERYGELRTETHYPPELDAMTPAELLERDRLLDAEVQKNVAEGGAERRPRSNDPAEVERWARLTLDREDWYPRLLSDVREAIGAKLDDLTARGVDTQEVRQLQATYDRLDQTPAYPPRLAHVPWVEQGRQAKSLQAAIEANEQRLAAPESDAQRIEILKQNAAMKRELGFIKRSLDSVKDVGTPTDKGGELTPPDLDTGTDPSATRLAGEPAPGAPVEAAQVDALTPPPAPVHELVEGDPLPPGTPVAGLVGGQTGTAGQGLNPGSAPAPAPAVLATEPSPAPSPAVVASEPAVVLSPTEAGDATLFDNDPTVDGVGAGTWTDDSSLGSTLLS